MAGLYDYLGGLTKWHVWLSNGSNAFNYQWWWSSQGQSASCNDLGGYTATRVKQAVAGDFNNDGKDDVAALYDYGVQPSGQSLSRWHVWLTNTQGTCFEYQGSGGWWSREGYTASLVRHAEAGLLDASTSTVTGPADIAALYDYGAAGARWHVWLSNGSSAFNYQGPSGWWRDSSYGAASAASATSADLSGDGLEDVATLYDTAPGAEWHAWRSLGGTAVTVADENPLLPKIWWDAASGYTVSAARHAVAGPFNSGAGADIAIMYRYDTYHTRWQVFPSTR